MLQVLNGQCHCLTLVAVYETPRSLYLVTEYCRGGNLLEYREARLLDENTNTLLLLPPVQVVTRIAGQLLSAVHHCAQHGIIHRDIKAENIMFVHAGPDAALRLIDFGSGTLQGLDHDTNEPVVHETYAGSAFYVSPEMYQRSYTFKTDVWSAGVVLYVLVAGYPDDDLLQKAFNTLQSSRCDRIETLPNLPHNHDMPRSFYSLLEAALTYRHRRRPSAGSLLSESEFLAAF